MDRSIARPFAAALVALVVSVLSADAVPTRQGGARPAPRTYGTAAPTSTAGVRGYQVRLVDEKSFRILEEAVTDDLQPDPATGTRSKRICVPSEPGMPVTIVPSLLRPCLYVPGDTESLITRQEIEIRTVRWSGMSRADRVRAALLAEDLSRGRISSALRLARDAARRDTAWRPVIDSLDALSPGDSPAARARELEKAIARCESGGVGPEWLTIARLNLASALEEAGESARSVGAYEEALVTAPASFQPLVLLRAVRLRLSLLYIASGLYGPARAALTSVRRLEPDHPDAALLLASLSLDLEDGHEALDLIAEAERLNPGRPEPFFLKACLYASRGGVEPALGSIDRALELARDDAWQAERTMYRSFRDCLLSSPR